MINQNKSNTINYENTHIEKQIIKDSLEKSSLRMTFLLNKFDNSTVT